MNLNRVTNHPLIKSEQTYVLDRKIVSIHSVDRDYQKWPNSNHFGIDLGEAHHNVQSMRLIDFAVPSTNYTFATSYQNTKMSFTYKTHLSLNLGASDLSYNDLTGGYYTQFEFINEVMRKLTQTTSPNDWNPNLPADVKVYVKQVDGSFLPATTIADETQAPWLPTGMDTTNAEIQIRWEPSEFSITIPEGAYSPDNLTTTIQTLMNKELFNATSGIKYAAFPLPGNSNGDLNYNGLLYSPDDPNSIFYRDPTNPAALKPFIVYYNSTTNKLLVGSKQGEFTLNFSKQEIYDPTCDINKAIFHQYTKWGLPSYLGFDKLNYIGALTEINPATNAFLNNIGGLYLPSEPVVPWLSPEGFSALNITGVNEFNAETASLSSVENKKVYDVGATHNLDINGEDAIYMQVDRFNNIDEIYPYSERTGHLYNNDLGQRVNGSFAKIPITHTPFGQQLASRTNFLSNIFHSEPPIQRVDRLVFSFRYHDGRMVDFKNLPFSFTLELNMLKDEPARVKQVRVPHLYNL